MFRQLVALSILVLILPLPSLASTTTFSISGEVYGTDTLGLFGKAGLVLDKTAYSFDLAFNSSLLANGPFNNYYNSPDQPILSDKLQIGMSSRSILDTSFSYSTGFDPLFMANAVSLNVSHSSFGSAFSSYGETLQVYGTTGNLPDPIIGTYSASTNGHGSFFNAIYTYSAGGKYEQLALGVENISINEGRLALPQPVPLPPTFYLMLVPLSILAIFRFPAPK